MNRLEISNNHFILERDDEVTIERVDQIKTCEMNKDFISLNGSTTYLLPKKSMSEDDYNKITNLLKEKITSSLHNE